MIAVIEDLVGQYAEQAAFAWTQRARAVCSATFKLSELAEVDERLAAYIECLHASSSSGWRHAREALVDCPGPGEAFVAGVLALETCDAAALDLVITVAEASPQALPGVVSAFGWVQPTLLRGIVSNLIGSSSASQTFIGVAACVLHGVSPYNASTHLINHPVDMVRARALRAAGELGEVARLNECLDHLRDTSELCRTWAAWSAVLLGDRRVGLDSLASEAVTRPGGVAFDLLLQVLPPADAHAWLRSLASKGVSLRTLLRGSGRIGDAAYVPWLLDRMTEPDSAQAAGEAFALITGADLCEAPLCGQRLEGARSGPTDDPDDPDVELDSDGELPWPNHAAVTAWWQEHRTDFSPGSRRFLGQEFSREALELVLIDGYQMHRLLAAQALAVLQPGRPLFNVAAPSRRQFDSIETMK